VSRSSSRTSASDNDRDPKIVGDLVENPTNVALIAEIQSFPVGETCSEGLGDEPPQPAVARRYLCGFVEQRSGVEDGEDLGIGESDGVAISGAQRAQDLRELATTWTVEASEKAPVATRRKRQVLGIGQRHGPVTRENPDRQVLIDDDHEWSAPRLIRLRRCQDLAPMWDHSPSPSRAPLEIRPADRPS